MHVTYMVEQEVIDENGLLLLPVVRAKHWDQLLVALPLIAGDHFVRTQRTLERCAPLRQVNRSQRQELSVLVLLFH
jgi:hypothetical protein